MNIAEGHSGKWAAVAYKTGNNGGMMRIDTRVVSYAICIICIVVGVLILMYGITTGRSEVLFGGGLLTGTGVVLFLLRHFGYFQQEILPKSVRT